MIWLSTWLGENTPVYTFNEHHCVVENVLYQKSIFQLCSCLVLFCRLICKTSQMHTHIPDISWVSVCPSSDCAITGMTSAHPAGKANFHTDNRRARLHLCSWVSKQELRQTDKNSDEMCRPPKRKYGRKRHGRKGREKHRQAEWMTTSVSVYLPLLCADEQAVKKLW